MRYKCHDLVEPQPTGRVVVKKLVGSSSVLYLVLAILRMQVG
jgi:hypothetical protein